MAGSPNAMRAAADHISTTQAGPIFKMPAVADAGAISVYTGTISAYAGTISAFTAPAPGAVTVTSAAAGDLTTTANAVATLRGEVNTLNTSYTTVRGEVATLNTAVTTLRNEVNALRTTVNALLAAQRTAGALTT